MPISYIYTGQPMNGTAQDDFFIAYEGSTGTDNNTILGNAGPNVLKGLGGNDIISALGSTGLHLFTSDLLNGGAGNDSLDPGVEGGARRCRRGFRSPGCGRVVARGRELAVLG